MDCTTWDVVSKEIHCILGMLRRKYPDHTGHSCCTLRRTYEYALCSDVSFLQDILQPCCMNLKINIPTSLKTSCFAFVSFFKFCLILFLLLNKIYLSLHIYIIWPKKKKKKMKQCLGRQTKTRGGGMGSAGRVGRGVGGSENIAVRKNCCTNHGHTHTECTKTVCDWKKADGLSPTLVLFLYFDNLQSARILWLDPEAILDRCPLCTLQPNKGTIQTTTFHLLSLSNTPV